LKAPQHPAIIIGGGSANGLGIARNLGSLGIPIYCLIHNAHDLTRFTKYATRYAILPQIEGDVETLQQVLLKLQKQLTTTAVLFPTTDTALLTVSQLSDDLDGYVTSLANRELIEMMVLKSRFYASLRQWDVPHPRTWYPDCDSWSQIADQLSFPVFVRPDQSRAFTADFHVKGYVAHSLRETQAYLHHAQQAGHSMTLQEIIPGPPSTEYAIRGYMDKQSQPIVLMAIQRIRSFQMFKPRPIMWSIPLSTVGDFAKVIITYLQNIKYSGLFVAEFKRDPRDDAFKLFEINARSGGDNDFVRACGVNHILAAYRDALGKDVTPVTSYEVGRYNINLKYELWQNLWRVIHGQRLIDTLPPYLGKKKWHSFSTADPLPFIADMVTAFV
jgi:predicted ATP-grasp superfamily ATP-dependent carboligase